MIIVGCSGLGSETAWLARRNDFAVDGFLDDNIELHNTQFEGAKVLGAIDSAINYLDNEFVVAIANPEIRKAVVQRLRELGISKFPSLIDKQAIVGDTSTLGLGCIVFPGAIITVNCHIGDFTIVNKNCSVGHDASLSSYCTLAPLAMTGGHVKLGEGVDVGASSCIRQGLTVGAFAKIGMGSVVVKPVEPQTTVVGNPAKPLKR